MTKSDRAREDTKMSVTPTPPGRGGHVAPMVLERVEGGHAARGLRCGNTGPVRGTPGEAR